DEAVGTLAVAASEPHALTEQHLRLLETFADQGVSAMGNAPLFAELQERLEEQTATAEVLRVISESPQDLDRVFDAIADNAMRLGRTRDVSIWLREGEGRRLVADRGTINARFGLTVLPLDSRTP